MFRLNQYMAELHTQKPVRKRSGMPRPVVIWSPTTRCKHCNTVSLDLELPGNRPKHRLRKRSKTSDASVPWALSLRG